MFPQYTAAAKQSQLEGTSKAIASLAQILKQDPKLNTLIGAPTLKAEDKSQIVAELEKHTGGADKSGTVKNFLSTLAANNRLGLLEGVCAKFGELMSASKGEIELRVTSAQVRTSPRPRRSFHSMREGTDDLNRNLTQRLFAVLKPLLANPNTVRARSSRSSPSLMPASSEASLLKSASAPSIPVLPPKSTD